MKTVVVDAASVYTGAALVGLGYGHFFSFPCHTHPIYSFLGAVFRKHGFVKIFYLYFALRHALARGRE